MDHCISAYLDDCNFKIVEVYAPKTFNYRKMNWRDFIVELDEIHGTTKNDTIK